MILGLILGFAAGVAAGWLGAPLAGAELRKKAADPDARKSLADSLKKRDQTVAAVRQKTEEARSRLEEIQHGAGESAAQAADSARQTLDQIQASATRAADTAVSAPRGVLDAVKDRLQAAREAAGEGYDEGVRDAERLYEDSKAGRYPPDDQPA